MFATTDSVVSKCRCNACSVLKGTSCNFCQDQGYLHSTISTYFSFRASKPTPGSDSFTLLMITAPSSPAFASNTEQRSLQCFQDDVGTGLLISLKRCSQLGNLLWIAWMYAEPPPATIPSSTAALVACQCIFHTKLCILSFLSQLLHQHGLLLHRLTSFASLSCSFSLSKLRCCLLNLSTGSDAILACNICFLSTDRQR